MATILFAAAGAALGSGIGGTVLGLSGAVVGRAVGATLGRLVDQRIMGLGSDPVEVGRLDRFHVMGASEGAAIAQAWGRVRLAGQVIWSSPFRENQSSSGGGKGQPRVTSYSYSVSIAVALCEGEILGIGRIWADGREIAPASLNLRLYQGGEAQLPDPLIELHHGFGHAPAYRGTAYVVIEDMNLSPFGSRLPQLSFEVIRRAQGEVAAEVQDYAQLIRAAALIPGSGEYALATDRVRFSIGGDFSSGLLGPAVNANTPMQKADLSVSLDQMRTELPNCGAVSLVVSWFGEDLRCAQSAIQPKVEQNMQDVYGGAWAAGGIGRSQAKVLAQSDGRVIYGGTPADAAVIQAIRKINAGGQSVMFYPFILMDQLADNGLTDPYTGAADQPVLPWRGRITCSVAPGREGSPDQTAVAAAEVAQFFGNALPGHFTLWAGGVHYFGPAEWSYRRFILHYAYLCKLAGGVEAFCIGSELRGITQIRGPDHSFPAVQALVQLAQDVRAILGPEVKISYAADWSEYFGYHTGDHVYFHLDPLWADPAIDFIGIDNYMPLSDWRDGTAHADADWGAIWNLEYLKSNVCGGEGYDWYYDGPEGEAAQYRRPITDSAHGEDWVFRYKDLRGWWQNAHHNRIAGVRATVPTAWVPGSKPIRFTEYGCAAIDKGTNTPNRFLDHKSSESLLPRSSQGTRDDFIQFQYFRAINSYWADPAHNPLGAAGKPMLDLAHCYAWAWDARPFPEFPRHTALWADGDNYHLGHWLNGRATAQPLARVVRDLCASSGVTALCTDQLYGMVHGYTGADGGTARAALQPLSMVYGFDCVENEGVLSFVSRGFGGVRPVDPDLIALDADGGHSLERIRAPAPETPGRVRFGHIAAEGNFAPTLSEVLDPDAVHPVTAGGEYGVVMPLGQAKSVAERWLAEGRSGQDMLKLRLPLSQTEVKAGAMIALDGVSYRIDTVELDEARQVEAVRIAPEIYQRLDALADQTQWQGFEPVAPLFPLWLDLPFLQGGTEPVAPYVAITSPRWRAAATVWSADQDSDYTLQTTVNQPAVIGQTLNVLSPARAGTIDRGAGLELRLFSGQLTSVTEAALLNGSNAFAIGDGSSDHWEVFQAATVELVAPRTYRLSTRLRGQVGTDAKGRTNWPAGSYVVLLGPMLPQIELTAAQRGVERHYRFATLGQPHNGAEAVHQQRAFKGEALRPLSVCHLRGQVLAGGDHRFSWIRRTRIGGDSWDGYEVPLGEERELYEVQVIGPGGTVLRRNEVTLPHFTYSSAQRSEDGILGGYTLELRQISMTYGAGAARTLAFG